MPDRSTFKINDESSKSIRAEAKKPCLPTAPYSTNTLKADDVKFRPRSGGDLRGVASSKQDATTCSLLTHRDQTLRLADEPTFSSSAQAELQAEKT
jgi:hypothetical protein